VPYRWAGEIRVGEARELLVLFDDLLQDGTPITQARLNQKAANALIAVTNTLRGISSMVVTFTLSVEEGGDAE